MQIRGTGSGRPSCVARVRGRRRTLSRRRRSMAGTIGIVTSLRLPGASSMTVRIMVASRAGKSLLLVIDDDTGSGVLRDFDQGDAAVVRARTGQASNVNALTALQSLPDRRNFPAREFAAEPMETATRHQRLTEPPRDAIGQLRDAGMPRPDPWFLCVQAVCLERVGRQGN